MRAARDLGTTSASAPIPVDNKELWVLHALLHAELGETLEDFTDTRCAAAIRIATGVPDLEMEIRGKARLEHRDPGRSQPRLEARGGPGRLGGARLARGLRP